MADPDRGPEQLQKPDQYKSKLKARVLENETT